MVKHNFPARFPYKMVRSANALLHHHNNDNNPPAPLGATRLRDIFGLCFCATSTTSNTSFVVLYYFDYFLCCTVLPRPIPPPLCSLPRGLDPPPPTVILGASWGHLGVIFGHLGVFLSTSWTILGILGRLLFILGVTLTSRTPRWPQDGTKMSPRRLQHSHLET